MNYRDFLQKIIYQCINPLIKGMIKIGVTPNIITFMGFVGNIIAAAFFVLAAMKLSSDFQTDHTATFFIGWGGGIILFAGLFDMIDGRLARLGNMSSVFGALWDSTLDRYSELVSLFGIVLIFIENDQFVMGIVTFAAMIGSVMVSYVRARAEGINLECKVGFMQRPERVVVTAVTALISGFMQSMTPLAIGMIIIAIFANMTAFWRIGYCYKQLNKNGKNN
nr:CDP-alcohol phosphatidyltransferase family protein [Prevotella sp.]